MEAAWEHLLADVGDPDRAATDVPSPATGLRHCGRWIPPTPVGCWPSPPRWPRTWRSGRCRITPATEPARARRSLRAVLRSASSRLTFRSVWFRNSVRGAVGLSLAVAVVEATDVQHGFWVVLGTLSVLRSNALGTGANALRAVAGTVAGFVVGSVLLVALGPHLGLLWAVLPFAVLLAGVAPSAISFAVGQAGFTVAVVIVFNIIDPVGWRVGLVRVEDVAIGVLVSIVVGLLFWPRGAPAELARTLGEAYAGATAWLVVEIGRAGVPDAGTDDEAPRTVAMGQRPSAGRRLPTVHERAGRQANGPAGRDPPGDRMCPGPVDGADTGFAAEAYAAPPGAPPLAAVRSVAEDVTEDFVDGPEVVRGRSPVPSARGAWSCRLSSLRTTTGGPSWRWPSRTPGRPGGPTRC